MNSLCPYICNNKTEYGYCKTTGCINPKRQSQAFTTTDGFWYHGNGKIGGEFYPTKPNNEERYGEYIKVKHGHWIEDEYGIPHCSECKAINNTVFRNYCPNCGTDMREVEECD